MMARSNLQRSSTLIDPESLKQRPQSQTLNTLGADLVRRNSKGKPLINFDDEIPGARTNAGNNSQQRGGNARSVFGVDTLWERELVKLRDIEERERVEEQERAKREAEEESKRFQKGKGKRKGKNGSPEQTLSVGISQQSMPESVDSPPVLPDIQKASAPRRRPPPPTDDNDSEESGSDESDVMQQRNGGRPTEDWHAGSSDEEGPRRITGAGPRCPNRQKQPQQPSRRLGADSDSEEDLPLVATIGRAVERVAQARIGHPPESSDSDEEKPLSQLLDAKLKSPTSPSAGSNLFPSPKRAAGDDSEEEDDKPLGLRASRILPSSSDLQNGGGDDDDDKPLAFHPDQVRKTQYAAMQQQQFMMQAAQMQQSMYFGAPSMMGSGFFGPPMAPPMMMATQSPMVAPAPVGDAAKFGRVDKWRHDVAVEGEPPS